VDESFRILTHFQYSYRNQPKSRFSDQGTYFHFIKICFEVSLLTSYLLLWYSLFYFVVRPRASNYAKLIIWNLFFNNSHYNKCSMVWATECIVKYIFYIYIK